LNNRNISYGQILKSTSIFGSVQLVLIFFGVLKSKSIAVLIGPEGIGVSSILQISLNLIAALTSFGLTTSGVKEMSEAYATNDQFKINKTYTILIRLLFFTGLVGTFLTIFFSSLLSNFSFQSYNYLWSYFFLSITLLLNQLSAGFNVLLQSFRRITTLAKSTLYGGGLSIIVIIPLYFFYRLNAIVPALIITSLTTLIMNYYFTRDLNVKFIKLSWWQVLNEGGVMMRMGFLISLSTLITLASSYLISIYISKYGGLSDVGLYNAGFAIINTYVGMIFTAMATDYYPRLSQVSADSKLITKTVNEQAEIGTLLLSPIIIIFIVLIKFIISFLYSEDFIAINVMMIFAAFGMLFKSLSWSIAFIFLAKGESKKFFWNELLFNVWMLGLSILGYRFYGLTGIGVSFLVTYIIYLCQVYFLAKRVFNFKFNNLLIRIFLINLSITVSAAVAFLFTTSLLNYVFSFILLVTSVIYNFRILNSKIPIYYIIKTRFIKFFN